MEANPKGRTLTHKSHALGRNWGWVVFIFAFLLYSNTFSHGYALDDDVVYLKNRHVQKGLDGLKDIFSNSFIHGFTGHNDQSYRPVVLAVYAIQFEIFGNNPHAQHFVNVLLFALSCWFLYKLLVKLFSGLGFKKGILPLLPVTAVLLFAAHPIHTEAVANIKGLDEILSFLFLMLTLLFSLQYIDSGKKKFLFVSVLFFFLSLLSKEMAVTFLVIVPLTVYFFRQISLKRTIFFVLPFAGTFLFYFLIRSLVLDVITFQEDMKVVNNALVAAASESNRIATALFILGKYMLLLFFPHPLSWDYSYNQIPIVSFTHPATLIVMAVFLGLAMYVIRALFRNIKSEKVFVYCILFFFITMSVVSNVFIMIGATLGERFLFTPSLSFCIAVPFFASRFGKKTLLISVGIISAMFSFKTFSRNWEWKDNFSLFLSGVEACPASSRAQSAAGSAYRDLAEKEPDPKKRLELFQKAIPYYLKAIEILPENTEALYNLGVSYYSIGNKDSALKAYEQALSISPEYTSAANNAGVIYFERKEFEKAKKYFLQAIQHDANNADALGNLGAISHNTGNLPEAIDYYKKSLRLNPGNQKVRNNLSLAERSLQNRKH